MTKTADLRHHRLMQLSPTLAWLVDAASDSPGADRLLAELGAHLLADGVPLAAGSLTLEVPHPLIAKRTWLWRADNGRVIEALGFAPGGLAPDSPNDAGRRWLRDIAGGEVHEDVVGRDGPLLGWIGTRPFTADEIEQLRQAARFAATPLAVLAARATLRATLEAYLGKRSAERVLAAPLRRDLGETIQAALLYADLRGFTTLSETSPPADVIAALDAWFDRIAGAVHAFGGEVLKFIGDGVLAIFPVVEASPRRACDAALRAAGAAEAGMALSQRGAQHSGVAATAHSVPPFISARCSGAISVPPIGWTSRRSVPPSISPAGLKACASRSAGPCWSRARSPPRRTCLWSRSDRIQLRGIASPCEVFALPETQARTS